MSIDGLRVSFPLARWGKCLSEPGCGECCVLRLIARCDCLSNGISSVKVNQVGRMALSLFSGTTSIEAIVTSKGLKDHMPDGAAVRLVGIGFEPATFRLGITERNPAQRDERAITHSTLSDRHLGITGLLSQDLEYVACC